MDLRKIETKEENNDRTIKFCGHRMASKRFCQKKGLKGSFFVRNYIGFQPDRPDGGYCKKPIMNLLAGVVFVSTRSTRWRVLQAITPWGCGPPAGEFQPDRPDGGYCKNCLAIARSVKPMGFNQIDPMEGTARYVPMVAYTEEQCFNQIDPMEGTAS
jgi:hypothetical protein